MHAAEPTQDVLEWRQAVRTVYDSQREEGVTRPRISQELLILTPGNDIFCRLGEIGLQIQVHRGIGVYLSEVSAVEGELSG